MDYITITVPRGSHWMRYRVISEFVGFPNEIAGIIADYMQILKLRDWITPDKIDPEWIIMNPDAFAADMIPDIELADPVYLVENPSAIEYIKRHADRFLQYPDKWGNPKIVEWLFSLDIYPENIDDLINAESKLAVDKVIEINGNLDKSVFDLSNNPMAIDLIRNNLHVIDHEWIWANSAAIDILHDMISSGEEIDWGALSVNNSEWALKLLQENQDKISWNLLSRNPKIFEPADHPNKKELILILTGVDLTGSST